MTGSEAWEASSCARVEAAASSVVAEARRRRASRRDVVVADREWCVTMSTRSVTVASVARASRAEHCRRGVDEPAEVCDDVDGRVQTTLTGGGQQDLTPQRLENDRNLTP